MEAIWKAADPAIPRTRRIFWLILRTYRISSKNESLRVSLTPISSSTAGPFLIAVEGHQPILTPVEKGKEDYQVLSSPESPQNARVVADTWGSAKSQGAGQATEKLQGVEHQGVLHHGGEGKWKWNREILRILSNLQGITHIQDGPSQPSNFILLPGSLLKGWPHEWLRGILGSVNPLEQPQRWPRVFSAWWT